MANPQEFLKKYVLSYLESRNAFFRDTKEFKEEGNEAITQIKKDGEKRAHIIMPFLENISEIKEKANKNQGGKSIINTFNTKENIEFLKKNWHDIKKIEKISFTFFNPFTKEENKWNITPEMHAFISDEKTEIKSIDSLSENIEKRTNEELKKILC